MMVILRFDQSLSLWAEVADQAAEATRSKIPENELTKDLGADKIQELVECATNLRYLLYLKHGH